MPCSDKTAACFDQRVTAGLVTALEEHLAWHKAFVGSVASGQARDIPEPCVSGSSSCFMGKWIKNNERTLSKVHGFSDLKDRHDEFHRLAKIARQMVVEGNGDEAAHAASSRMAAQSGLVENAAAALIRRLAGDSPTKKGHGS